MLTIKQGDTHNAIQETLLKNGAPINLTNCKVFITVFGIVENGECMLVDAEKGIVAYPVFNITNKSGFYSYDFTIEYPDGTKEFVPNDDNNKIRIFDRG